MERRVVITGLGAITPIGKDVNDIHIRIIKDVINVVIYL